MIMSKSGEISRFESLFRQKLSYLVVDLLSMDKLYENIRKIRTIKGLSQQNMADELGISQKHYSRIERGDVDISYSVLCKITSNREVKIDRLIGDIERVFIDENAIAVDNKTISEFYERIIKEKENTIALLQN